MTDWRHDVIPRVIELLDEYEYRPTVRGMFYRLVSDEIISNTFNEYKGLIQALGTARNKDPEENGYISPFAFSDDSRYIEDIDDVFVSQQDYVDLYIDKLRNADETYFEDGCLPLWYRQPNIMFRKSQHRPIYSSDA